MGAAEKPPFLLRIHLQATEGAKGSTSALITLYQPDETIAIQSLPEVTEKEILKVSTRVDGTVLVEFSLRSLQKLRLGFRVKRLLKRSQRRGQSKLKLLVQLTDLKLKRLREFRRT